MTTLELDVTNNANENVSVKSLILSRVILVLLIRWFGVEEDMKIGTITFHWATNYGAVLQAFAYSNT